MRNTLPREPSVAATQNKFWEMHDYLYEHQQALDDNHLEKYASKLGLDITKFNHDMSMLVHEPCTRGFFKWGA